MRVWIVKNEFYAQNQAPCKSSKSSSRIRVRTHTIHSCITVLLTVYVLATIILFSLESKRNHSSTIASSSSKIMLFPPQLQVGISPPKFSRHGTLPVGKHDSVVGKVLVKQIQDLTGGSSILKPSSLLKISHLQKPLHGKALIIIATYPSNNLRLAAIWSQLECFKENVDKIIIVAPTFDYLKASILNFEGTCYGGNAWSCCQNWNPILYEW